MTLMSCHATTSVHSSIVDEVILSLEYHLGNSICLHFEYYLIVVIVDWKILYYEHVFHNGF